MYFFCCWVFPSVIVSADWMEYKVNTLAWMIHKNRFVELLKRLRVLACEFDWMNRMFIYVLARRTRKTVRSLERNLNVCVHMPSHLSRGENSVCRERHSNLGLRAHSTIDESTQNIAFHSKCFGIEVEKEKYLRKTNSVATQCVISANRAKPKEKQIQWKMLFFFIDEIRCIFGSVYVAPACINFLCFASCDAYVTVALHGVQLFVCAQSWTRQIGALAFTVNIIWVYTQFYYHRVR